MKTILRHTLKSITEQKIKTKNRKIIANILWSKVKNGKNIKLKTKYMNFKLHNFLFLPMKMKIQFNI